ncbi:Co2+/Mg2+ efflux protein ApaG [Melaminivora sp.]|uniref:Co2+/Mg2+ efflux protein ApaG n=1 Tax=Melaminivora sp. TaxID=1933032 RepID=UPI0028AC91C0|nr:Co2+/Mg2+ efflux protein ApaG [Melaminivora sp.]
MSLKYQFQVDVQTRHVPEPSDAASGAYSFAYTITVTNTGTVAAQLIARHWTIVDENGHTEEVRGLGVVGHQPLLRPGQSFQYTSGCRLRTARGTMRGSYFCVAEDGERFDCPVPEFVLQAGAADMPPPDAPAPRVLH